MADQPPQERAPSAQPPGDVALDNQPAAASTDPAEASAPPSRAKRRWTRRKALAALLTGGSAAGATYGIALEPNDFDHQKIRLGLLPPGAKPVRLLHLSDFHASLSTPLSRLDRAFAEALRQPSDLCVITGDFITQSLDEPEAYAQTLRVLSDAMPTFAVLGNHDGGSGWDGTTGHCPPDHLGVEKLLTDSRITLLHNRAVRSEHHGNSIALVGTGDLWQEECLPQPAFAEASALNQNGPAACTILLTHNPDAKEVCADYPWDLMLAGHTHGGQIIIPFLGAPMMPIKDRRFAAGLVPWNNRLVYVTRGVGSLLSVRVNCPPEITHIELVARDA